MFRTASVLKRINVRYVSQIANTLSLSKIIERLAECGVNAERKTLYQDLNELRSFGFEINADKGGRSTRYYLENSLNSFQYSKMLIDIIQTSPIISAHEAEKLTNAVKDSSVLIDRAHLHRNILSTKRLSHADQMVRNNLNTVHSAIHEHRQISFRYFLLNIKKEAAYGQSGGKHRISPWSVVWDGSYFFLLSYDTMDARMKYFRIDKMTDIIIKDEKCLGQQNYEEFVARCYDKDLFEMYPQQHVPVTFEYHKNMIGIMVDRFGESIDISMIDDTFCKSAVNVVVSQQLLGWIISMAGAIRVISPDFVIDQITDLLDTAEEQYRSN